jgi:NADPH-dependent curcumin reductase CurA
MLPEHGDFVVVEAMNTQIHLASRPSGWVDESNFTLSESAIVRPGDGEVLVRNIFMSVDPYMRGRMNDVKSYIPPFQIGEVLQAGVIGQVVESRFDGIGEGEFVMGMLGWENYSVSDGRLLRKIPAGPLPLSYHLGILGMPGMTAYVGLIKIAEAKAGDNVFVTAASGAVGSVVGQLAKIHGCTVAGSAGSDEKVASLTEEFGYDAAFNYKTSASLGDSVRKACPKGVDVLFENVGGEILEAVLWNMRDYGRIALCGMIADYNLEEPQPGPRGMMLMIGRRLRLQGFIVTDHPEACEEYARKAVGWLQEGKLTYRESITEGVENAPQAFIDLLKGRNIGKQIVQLSDSD